MAQRLIPGYGWIDEVGSGQSLIPGFGFVDIPAAGGALDAIAPGTTLTGTATMEPGSASGGASTSATAAGVTLTGTSTLVPGSASAALVASFTTPEPLENGAGSLWLDTAVVWSWTQEGRIGNLSGKTVVDGTGTTHATTGLFTATGLPVGDGMLQVAILGVTPDLDAVYHIAGTAA